jgi:phosphoenolpyruvate carboxylase
LKCYIEIRNLKRKFYNVDVLISELEQKLYRSCFILKAIFFITLEDFKAQLNRIKTIVVEQHQSLYLDQLEALIIKVFIWFSFCLFDIRQNSKIHEVFKDVYDFYINSASNVFPANYYDLPRKQKFDVLSKVKGNLNPADFTNEITRSTIESIQAIEVIQENNGELEQTDI